MFLLIDGLAMKCYIIYQLLASLTSQLNLCMTQAKSPNLGIKFSFQEFRVLLLEFKEFCFVFFCIGECYTFSSLVPFYDVRDLMFKIISNEKVLDWLLCPNCLHWFFLLWANVIDRLLVLFCALTFSFSFLHGFRSSPAHNTCCAQRRIHTRIC